MKYHSTGGIFSFLYRLDNSKVAGIAFAGIFLIIVFWLWYWIMFRGGAKAWGKDIIKYQRKLGMKTGPEDIMIRPITLKVVMTVLVFGSAIGITLAIYSMLR